MRKFLSAIMMLITSLCIAVACNGGGGGPNSSSSELDHDHEYNVRVINEVDCETDGLIEYVCWCGHSYQEPQTALGHEWQEANCQRPSTCERCGDTTGDVGLCQIETFEEVSPATCMENKVEGGNCIWCGTFQEREVPNSKIAHDFSLVVYESEATCLKNASTVYECNYEDCEETLEVEEEGTQLEHSYTDVYDPWVSQEATCTLNKVVSHYCDNGCGVLLDEVFEDTALGHDETLHPARASDCDLVGWEAYTTCSRCDTLPGKVEIPALQHHYVDGVCENCHYYEPTQGLRFSVNYSDKYGCEVANLWGEDNLTGEIDLVIPATYQGVPVVEIADNALSTPSGQVPRYQLTSVKIPKYVERIGEGAFFGQTIGAVEFFGTPRIETNLVANSVYVSSIEQFLSIEVSDGEYSGATWGDLYIDGVKKTEVAIPNTVETIGDYAFAGSSITAISISDSVKEIGKYAFKKSAIESVSIPANVKSIGAKAFESCYSLSSLTLVDGLEEIGQNAFSLTSIANVVVPGTVEEIGAGAFGNIDGLISVEIKEGVKVIGNSAFAGRIASFSLENVTLADSIEIIGDYAFDYSYGEVKETELILPASLKEIGQSAFVEWRKVEKIVVPASLEKAGEYAFENIGLQSENGLEIHVEDVESFWNIEFGPSGTISNWIMYAKFFVNGEEITRLVVPESVTEVNVNFISGTYTEVVIHKGVTKIVDYAFAYSNLQTIYYEGTETEWAQITLGAFESPWLTGINIIYNSAI